MNDRGEEDAYYDTKMRQKIKRFGIYREGSEWRNDIVAPLIFRFALVAERSVQRFPGILTV